MNPMTPAPTRRCPKLALAEPSGGSGVSLNTPMRAESSLRSPSCVPVPWHSTYPMLAGSTSATSMAWAMASAWREERGAVNEAF
ncbi:hypothetical protein SCALM49S_07047 [Streptomyces californicus]